MSKNSVPHNQADQQHEPGNSPDAEARLAETIAEQHKTQLRDMFQLFHDVTHAAALPETEQTAALQKSVDLILSDPGLTYTVLESFNELRPELPAYTMDARFEATRAALLEIADPETGTIPANFTLPPALQTIYDAEPELQAFRANLPSTMQDDYDDWVDRLTNSMRTELATTHTLPGPDPEQQDIYYLSDEWTDIVPEDAPLEMIFRGITPKGNDDAPNDTTGEPDDALTITTLYTSDPEGAYLLGLTIIPVKDDQVQVSLELRSPITKEWLVASRDQWQVHITLDGASLEVSADEFEDRAWLITPLVRRDDLPRLNFDVSFHFPADDGTSSG